MCAVKLTCLCLVVGLMYAIKLKCLCLVVGLMCPSDLQLWMPSYDKTREDETDLTCGMHGGEGKFIRVVVG
jgi:hypothetical protein